MISPAMRAFGDCWPGSAEIGECTLLDTEEHPATVIARAAIPSVGFIEWARRIRAEFVRVMNKATCSSWDAQFLGKNQEKSLPSIPTENGKMDQPSFLGFHG
jgi:hypothetical protein